MGIVAAHITTINSILTHNGTLINSQIVCSTPVIKSTVSVGANDVFARQEIETFKLSVGNTDHNFETEINTQLVF